MPRSELDAIDRKILAALQADGRMSAVDLADRVGLSPSPCNRRLKRLEDEGVIRGYRATLDRARLGLGLTVFVGVKVERHGDVEAQAFERAVQDVPEIVACHLVSGEMDFLMEIVAADLADYERLLRRVLLRLPGIKDLRSNFAMTTVKSAAPLPLGRS